MSRAIISSRVCLVGLASVALALGACGDDERPRADASDGSEVSEVTDTAAETVADVPADGDGAGETDGVDDTIDPVEVDGAEDAGDIADAQPDAGDTSDGDEIDVGPHACEDFTACDMPPDGDGLCPGTCRSTDDTLRCGGTVKHAVCHTITPIEVPTEVVDFGDYTVTPVQWPSDAVIGESYDLEVRVDNDLATPIVIPFRWKNPETWLIEDPSWSALAELPLEAGGSARLTAKITAQHPTVFSAGGDIIVTFVFGDTPYEPRATVHFPETEAIACGGEHFPASWCPGESCYESRNFYLSARCCDDVFFPGAMCCDDTDCQGGTCVDGRCLFGAPNLGSANNVPIGHQRIRLVLVDSHPQFTDPCADHSEDLGAEIDLAAVEAWYDALAERRLGRDAVDFRWIVTGGVATSDFLTGPAWWDGYSRELNAFLAKRGCPIFDAYDKVIVSSSTVDLMGFGGIYFDRGHIAVFSPYNPYLLAHELAHSFGASDLYLDLGGVFLYPQDLMGNLLSSPPLPGDKVAWAEMGFGDVDRDGVLDVVELAAFPETLTAANLTATLTTKNTIELRWEFAASEGDAVKQVVVSNFRVRVPAANADFEQTYAGRWKTVTFDSNQVDLAALEAAGVIELSLAATYRFTDRDWQPQVLTLDETYHVTVTRAP